MLNIDDNAARTIIATGRNRQAALIVIVARLRVLAGAAEFEVLEDRPGLCAEISCHRLNIRFWRNELGLYVGVDRGPGERLLMSGYVDPVESGRYAGGALDTMTWIRGWDAELFFPLH